MLYEKKKKKRVGVRILNFPLSSQALENKCKFLFPWKYFDCCSSSCTGGPMFSIRCHEPLTRDKINIFVMGIVEEI